MSSKRIITIAFTALSFARGAASQVTSLAGNNHAPAKCADRLSVTYLLGPDDEVEIYGPELDELTNKPARINGDGYIQVPLIGSVHLAGLSIREAEQELDKRLSAYIRQPRTALNMKELRSQPVSILGAVNSPGVHQVQGRKTLLEMLSLAGGIRSDAGYSVRITRQQQWGCIPLPNVTVDPSGAFSVAEVNLKDILDAKNPEENIAIMPHDVISVPKAEMIYVIGEVRRSGGFVLGEHESMSVLQALSLAEGLSATADARHAKILRPSGNAGSSQREEIAVDVKGILTGRTGDVSLRGDDILFIPGSMGKKTALRAIEAAIQTGTGLIIWRR